MSTNPVEVQESICGLRVGKALDRNSIPNRAVKRLSQRVFVILATLFNTILRTHHFPPECKYTGVISILKAGKDPALHLSYRPGSLLDTIGNVFEKILLAVIVN